MPFHTLNVPLNTVGDEQRLAFRPSETAIRQIYPSRTADYPRFGYAIGVHYKDRPETRVADKQRTFLIESQAVWSSIAEGLEEDSSFSRGAIIVKRQSPNLVRTRHCDIEEALIE